VERANCDQRAADPHAKDGACNTSENGRPWQLRHVALQEMFQFGYTI
jgi:hypothetical protein